MLKKNQKMKKLKIEKIKKTVKSKNEQVFFEKTKNSKN